eukprot:scaffold133236_cov61-Attheya_sp.AAC.2
MKTPIIPKLFSSVCVSLLGGFAVSFAIHDPAQWGARAITLSICRGRTRGRQGNKEDHWRMTEVIVAEGAGNRSRHTRHESTNRNTRIMDASSHHPNPEHTNYQVLWEGMEQGLTLKSAAGTAATGSTSTIATTPTHASLAFHGTGQPALSDWGYPGFLTPHEFQLYARLGLRAELSSLFPASAVRRECVSSLLSCLMCHGSSGTTRRCLAESIPSNREWRGGRQSTRLVPVVGILVVVSLHSEIFFCQRIISNASVSAR